MQKRSSRNVLVACAPEAQTLGQQLAGATAFASSLHDAVSKCLDEAKEVQQPRGEQNLVVSLSDADVARPAVQAAQ
jgi:hypothetical protein